MSPPFAASRQPPAPTVPGTRASGMATRRTFD
jgi:hypothetical protein